MARARDHSSDFGLFANKHIIKAVKPRKRSRKLSPEQQENTDRFKDAAAYASDCMRVPELKALYEKGINKRKNNAYTVACTDFLNPPKIHYINVEDKKEAGSTITIKATDDFEVTSVRITITGADGSLLEEGTAVRHRLKRQMWKYNAKAVSWKKGMNVTVVANDHAGNETLGTMVVE